MGQTMSTKRYTMYYSERQSEVLATAFGWKLSSNDTVYRISEEEWRARQSMEYTCDKIHTDFNYRLRKDHLANYQIILYLIAPYCRMIELKWKIWFQKVQRIGIYINIAKPWNTYKCKVPCPTENTKLETYFSVDSINLSWTSTCPRCTFRVIRARWFRCTKTPKAIGDLVLVKVIKSLGTSSTHQRDMRLFHFPHCIDVTWTVNPLVRIIDNLKGVFRQLLMVIWSYLNKRICFICLKLM